jgi:hypothetical protein
MAPGPTTTKRHCARQGRRQRTRQCRPTICPGFGKAHDGMGSELARTGPRNSRSVTNCSTATLAIGCGARGAIGCGARGAIVGRTLGMAKPSDTLSSARAAIRCANRSNCRGLMLSRARGAEKPTRSWSSAKFRRKPDDGTQQGCLRARIASRRATNRRRPCGANDFSIAVGISPSIEAGQAPLCSPARECRGVLQGTLPCCRPSAGRPTPAQRRAHRITARRLVFARSRPKAP